MELRLAIIENKIDALDTKLQKIWDLLENNVSKNCEKMETHIAFVENVYDNVKQPLQFICDKFNTLMIRNEDNKILPMKKNN